MQHFDQVREETGQGIMMRELALNKLKSNSGESIAETLVAVLIAAFALLMLAGTINTSSNLITRSQETMNDYYAKNNAVEERAASASGADKTASFAIIEGDESLKLDSCTVKTYKNDKYSSRQVVAYDKE